MATAPKTYTGGCHCGFLRYSFSWNPALSATVFGKCNCTSCLSRGILILDIEPPSSFTLKSPTSLSDPQLGKYSPLGGSLHFHFCKNCGVNCFYQGGFEGEAEGIEYVRINVLSLDPGQGIDFTRFKIEYWDGKNDNWEAGPKDEPWPGGCL